MAQSQTNIHGLWRENQELRLQLAATNAEKDDLIYEAKGQIEFLDKQLRAQLAEAQAEIERLKAEYAEDVGKLLRSTKYIAGIAERGFGAPQPDSVSVEDFVLGYVKQLEQQLAASQATNEKLLALEPEWIVNDMGELGVKVGSRFFFLYKGENIEYTSGKHDDGVEPILYRIVGKREFGETCKPDLYYSKGYAVTGRYTENLVFHQGLSFGSPEDGAWRPLPETGETLPNDTTALNAALAGVYEECAKECDRLDYWYSARAIRALAKQKGCM